MAVAVSECRDDLGRGTRRVGGGIGGRRRTLRRALRACALAALVLAAAPATTVQALPDNLGVDFWLGFPKNGPNNGGPFGMGDITLSISAPTVTTGTVTVPGLAFSAAFTVTPGTATTVVLPLAAQMPIGENTLANSVHVTAAKEVAVYGFNGIAHASDAYLGLPVDVLGTKYTIMAPGVSTPPHAELSVVAATNGTTVTITPRATAGIHPAGVPYTIGLSQGQQYQVHGNKLSGTRSRRRHRSPSSRVTPVTTSRTSRCRARASISSSS